MSWLSENYEKAALGVAAVAVTAVGYAVLSGGAKNPDPKIVAPTNDTEIHEVANLTEALDVHNSDYKFEPVKIEGNEVRSFIGYPLYSIKGQDGITALSDDYAIHPGMPIKWWKQYNLEDYTQVDGPDKDPDGDGFTNREEMEKGTNPTLAKDRPDYLAKLVCDKTNPSKYEISWTQADKGLGNFLFKYNDVNYRFRNLGIGSVFPNEEFRRQPNFVNRFEITGKGQDQDVAGETGAFYTIKDKLVDNTFKVFYRKRAKFNDWKATMSVNINVAGVNKPFSLAEGDTFSLPFDPNAKVKPYKFLFLKDEKFLLFEHKVKGLPSPLSIPIPEKKQ